MSNSDSSVHRMSGRKSSKKMHKKDALKRSQCKTQWILRKVKGLMRRKGYCGGKKSKSKSPSKKTVKHAMKALSKSLSKSRSKSRSKSPSKSRSRSRSRSRSKSRS